MFYKIRSTRASRNAATDRQTDQTGAFYTVTSDNRWGSPLRASPRHTAGSVIRCAVAPETAAPAPISRVPIEPRGAPPENVYGCDMTSPT